MEGFCNTDKASTFFTFGSVSSREMTAYTVSPPVKWTYNLFIPRPEFFCLSFQRSDVVDRWSCGNWIYFFSWMSYTICNIIAVLSEVTNLVSALALQTYRYRHFVQYHFVTRHLYPRDVSLTDELMLPMDTSACATISRQCTDRWDRIWNRMSSVPALCWASREFISRPADQLP